MSRNLFFVKAIHSLIFFFMVGCMFYILYAALTRSFNLLLLLAIAAIILEGIILLLNDGHCPLTKIAQKLGDPNGSVTDIFLPKVIARNTFRISFPLLLTEIVFVAIRYVGR
jgi:hypothetical protein